MNLLTFEDPAAVNLVRRALKLAAAGDLYGAAETANVDVGHAAAVSEGMRRGMRFSIGSEVDNDPRCRPDAAYIVEAMRPDGTIRAVHFLTIDHPTSGPGFQWAFDYPEFASLFDHVGVENVWRIYIDTLLETVEKLPGNIIAHFYKPALFGHWLDRPTLEQYEDRFIAACAASGAAVELNSRVFYRSEDEAQRARYREANLRLIRKAKARDVLVAVGSDAHSPKDQSGGFEEVLAMLDEAQINELAFPIGGRLARVALRVPREERPAAAVPEPAAPQPAAGAPEGARSRPSRGRAAEREHPKPAKTQPASKATRPAAKTKPATRAIAKKRPPAKKAASAKKAPVRKARAGATRLATARPAAKKSTAKPAAAKKKAAPKKGKTTKARPSPARTVKKSKLAKPKQAAAKSPTRRKTAALKKSGKSRR